MSQSLNLSIKLDGAEDVKAALAALGRDAVHARRLAVNSLGEHMQSRMQNQIPNRFTFRGTRSLFTQAIVFQEATASKDAILRVGSDGPMGKKASATKRLGQILARHEEASARTSGEVYRAGGKTFIGGFFLPAAGMRTASTNPARRLYPINIGAKLRSGDGRDGGQYFAKSKRETKWSRKTGQLSLGESFYAIPGVGIFMRSYYIGPKTKGERGTPLWWFSKDVRTPARLRLWETAEEVFDRFAIGHAVDAIDLVLSRSGF